MALPAFHRAPQIPLRPLPRLGDFLWRLTRLALATGDLPSEAGATDPQFEQIFARYQPALLEFLYGMTRDREWAADLLQDTFLCAYTAKREWATITYPQAWLYRIATNVSLKALQRRRRFATVSLNETLAEYAPHHAFTEPQSEDIAATIVERDAVWGVLTALPPRWRAVLLLQTVAGLSVREITAQLHMTEANVRKTLFRAKERYRTLHRQSVAEEEMR